MTKEEKEKAIKELEKELLGKYNQKAFLAYQWGVWVTSWSRFHLEEGIRLVHNTEGADFVYCDTDSVKYTGNVDWTDYNNARIMECRESGAFATDPSGMTHYMGVYETEDDPKTGVCYRYFKSLGAKKYVYQKYEGEKTVHCTIAGVNKEKGGEELYEAGGLKAFEDGFTFVKAGGTEAKYNDKPPFKSVEIDGHTLPIVSNIAILPSTYTVGFSGEYLRIVMYAKNYLDNYYVI